MLSYRAIDSLETLYKVLQEIDAHEYKDYPSVIMNDLTDQIYEEVTDKKGKVSKQLRAEYVVGFMSKTFEVKYDQASLPKGDGSTKLTLVFGVDIPDRGALKKLENEDTKVYLVTRCLGDGSDGFRHYTVIQSKRGTGIYAGIYTNTKYILPPPEKKKKKEAS
jgi:hypothetical protein